MNLINANAKLAVALLSLFVAGCTNAPLPAQPGPSLSSVPTLSTDPPSDARQQSSTATLLVTSAAAQPQLVQREQATGPSTGHPSSTPSLVRPAGTNGAIRFPVKRVIGTVVLTNGTTRLATGLIEVPPNTGVSLTLLPGLRPELSCADYSFALINVLNANDTLFRDSDVSFLKYMPNLVKLQLHGTDITDAGLEAMRGMRFHDLDVSETAIDGSGLAALTQLLALTIGSMDKLNMACFCNSLAQLSNLTVANFNGIEANDRLLEVMSHLPHLNYVHLDCTNVSTRAFNLLSNCKKISGLTLDGEYHPRELTALAKLPLLRQLNVPRVDDQDLKYLSHLTPLEDLNLARAEVTTEGLQHLGALPHLAKLGCTTDDAGVVVLSKFKHLTDLNLYGSSLTDSSVELLAKCVPLKSIVLSQCSISDRSLKALARCSTLESIDVSDTNIGEAGVLSLINLPNLKSLKIRNSRCPAAASQLFKQKRPDCAVEV